VHIGIILIGEDSNDVQQAGTIMMNSIDHIIGYHCAPAIRGIKLSNLVSIPRDMNEQIQFVLTEYNKEFNEKGLFFFELCRCKARRLLLVFREKQLRDYVRQPAVMTFLKAYGYHDRMSIMEMLEHLRYRMEASIDFPHEIGVFLGYPLKDVKCFISRRGSGYHMCGEWKVYHDVVDAQRSFLCYKACREFCQTQLMLGKTFSSLVARMAYEVAEGIKAAGQEVEVKSVSEVSVDDAVAYEKLALGCADMGAEQLEEGEFEPFYTELEAKLGGKKVAIFGSYGWGGTWLEDWGTRIKDAGGELVADGVAILGEPDDDGKAQCQELGKTLANA